MPYPDAVTYKQTTPETALDTQRNSIAGGIGNANTLRQTANETVGKGTPMAPYNTPGAPLYAKFGEGGTKDKFTKNITGLLADSGILRGFVRLRLRDDLTGTAAADNQFIFMLSSTFFLRWHAPTGPTARKFLFRCPVGTGPGNSASTWSVGPSTEILIVFEADTNQRSFQYDIYVNGSYQESSAGGGIAAAAPIALSGLTELAVGAAITGDANEATNFFRGDISELRLWFGAAAKTIELVQPRLLTPEVAVKTNSTNYTMTSNAHMIPGITALASQGGGFATVTSVGAGDETIVTSAWTGAEPLVTEPVTFTSRSPSHVSNIVNKVATTADGQLNGIPAQVYLGNAAGLALATWNAGTNPGTLGNFTGGTVS